MRPLVAIALVLSASAAHAQPKGNDKVDAKSLMASGVKLLEAKDYLGALAVFRDAYARFPSAKILLNIATTERYLGRNAIAANEYARYLELPDSDAKKRADVEAAIAELDKTVGVLELTVTPDGSELRGGDEDWRPVPKRWRVAPGTYTIELRHAGYKDDDTARDIAAGQRQALTVVLAEIPKTAPIVVEKVVHDITPVAVFVEGPRSRLGVLAVAHVDVTHAGGAGLVGLTIDATEQLQFHGAAILGGTFGGYLGASWAFLRGTWRPTLSVGMPVFESMGARYAVRAAGGLEIVASRHFALIIEVGVERNLNPESDIRATVFVPAVGAAARL